MNYYGVNYSEKDLNELIGLTLESVNVSDGRDEIDFVTTDGRKFRMCHFQNCCEDVNIEDINGDLQLLVGSPILVAESSSSRENPVGVSVSEYQDSFTWTFYRIATQREFVTIRWYGSSNGYYSEEVSFIEIHE